MSIADRNEIYLSGTVIRKNKYNGIVFINISTGTYVKNGHKYYTSPTVIFLNELAAEAKTTVDRIETCNEEEEEDDDKTNLVNIHTCNLDNHISWQTENLLNSKSTKPSY